MPTVTCEGKSFGVDELTGDGSEVFSARDSPYDAQMAAIPSYPLVWMSSSQQMCRHTATS